MTSHDVRDVLNLPADHASAPRPVRRQKTSAPRPSLKGLAREVQNLGGDNPIAIVPEVSVFKKRRLGSRKPAAKWELGEFRNSARGDDGALVLRHWRRKADGEAPLTERVQDVDMSSSQDGVDWHKDGVEDSAFAKYNVQVVVPQYSEDQYSSNLESDDWTKEETDYLLQLVKDYDLRWPIVWDRYEYAPRLGAEETQDGTSTAMIPAPKPRTMEDLKARYYEVAAKMMAAQKPAQYMTRPEFELYETMLNFNPAQERARKEFAINTMARSKDEAREEESLLLEIRRIIARTERFNEERRELYHRLDYPHTDQDISAYKSSTGLQTLLQNLMSIDKSKKRKSLMVADGASPATSGPNGQTATTTADAANRRESIAALGSVQRESQRATPAAAEAVATPASTNKKKAAAAQTERRKLSQQEEQIYGVSHHDRLGSGPTFRYEKINKLYSHKSGQQQMRITNALGELDVPPRLVMPTAAVTAQFESLWGAVTSLVDLRKVSDKLEAEIKLEEAKRAEKEKGQAVLGDGATEPRERNQTTKGTSGSSDSSAATGKPLSAGADSRTGPDGTGGGTAAQGEEAASDARATGPSAQPQAEPAVAEQAAEQDADGETGVTHRADPEGVKDGDAALETHSGDKGWEKDRDARPGSSGAHKRSASVLSASSEKNSKRQKR